jgi:DNA-binding XRE family transcriptional regulator
MYKHGETTHIWGRQKLSSEYTAWHNMKQRCLNLNNKYYKNYGGRGITIDPRWMQFENFLTDMGRRPTLKHTLERIDNNGNYTKSNCRWATRAEQNRNSRNTKLTQAMVDEINALYATCKYTQEKLGKKFGVTHTQIGYIVRGETWK